MECKYDFQDILDLVNDNSTNIQRIEISNHIETCDKCKSYLDSLKLTENFLLKEQDYPDISFETITSKLDMNKYKKKDNKQNKLFTKFKLILKPYVFVPLIFIIAFLVGINIFNNFIHTNTRLHNNDNLTIDQKLSVFKNSIKDAEISDPNEYINQNRQYLDELVKLGKPTVDKFLEQFKIGKSTATEEYIMAKICCEILGYQNPIKTWSTGREWYTKYIDAIKSPNLSTNEPDNKPDDIPKPKDGYRLAWNDEFGTNNIDKNSWNFDIGGNGWGNNELEYYTDRTENCHIEDGNLVIEARKENINNMSYTSSRLKTTRSWTYGKIEARIKYSLGKGTWPAFWLLGKNNDTVKYPQSGGLVIFDHKNQNSDVSSGIVWDYNGSQNYFINTTVDSNQYHTYIIDWDDKLITWFLDGKQYFVANIENNINGTDEFHKPFNIILNLAIGGNLTGNPDSSSIFPTKMLVDYVRVYQK